MASITKDALQASQVQPAHPVKGAEGKRAASCQRWIFYVAIFERFEIGES
jgi:hypothetical protein